MTDVKFKMTVTLKNARTFDKFFPNAFLKRFSALYGFQPSLKQTTTQFVPSKPLAFELTINTKLLPKSSIPIILKGMVNHKSIDRYTLKHI